MAEVPRLLDKAETLKIFPACFLNVLRLILRNFGSRRVIILFVGFHQLQSHNTTAAQDKHYSSGPHVLDLLRRYGRHIKDEASSGVHSAMLMTRRSTACCCAPLSGTATPSRRCMWPDDAKTLGSLGDKSSVVHHRASEMMVAESGRSSSYVSSWVTGINRHRSSTMWYWYG